MAIATRTANCRSSAASSLRSRTGPRIRSRASMNSLSSLACSAHLIARSAPEPISHLLKTANRNLPPRRNKSKHYFSPYIRLPTPDTPSGERTVLRWFYDDSRRFRQRPTERESVPVPEKLSHHGTVVTRLDPDGRPRLGGPL